jgi:cellulose synthase/poly-beta-1,6-N-acetylglucosamine synthase-like glycosyltransferase
MAVTAAESVDSSGAATAVQVSVVLHAPHEPRRLLRSLVALSRLPDRLSFEVVVIDNGSSEETSIVLGGVEGDLRTIRHDPPIARGRACDEAATRAAGRYLCFLSEDAVPVDGWLEPLVDALDRDPELGAIAARTAELSGRLLGEEQWMALAIRKTAFDQVGGFENTAQPLRWEGATLLEAIAAGGFRVATEPASTVLLAPGA